MKKLILSVLLVVVFSASAVTWREQSFLSSDIASVVVSNTIGVTNLSSTALFAGAGYLTNVGGLKYSNKLGQLYIDVITNISATGSITNVGANFSTVWGVGYSSTSNVLSTTVVNCDNKNVFADGIALWNNTSSDPVPFPGTGGASTNQTFGSIFIRLANNGSGANAAVTFHFVAVPDGVYENATEFTVAVTATASAASQVSLTPFNVGWFPNCKTLRLRSIDNADTDASSAVFVTDCKFIGFMP
jgi:hypothetical protein